jgi:hypothetical protein
MTEQEDKRFMRRKKIFMQEGLCDDDASDLAFNMLERDRDTLDDRRVCFECNNYVGKNCMKMLDRQGKPQMPLRFVLQRCENFKLKVTK